MNKILYRFRFFSWIAIICSLLGSLLMFVIGAIKTYYAFAAVLFGRVPKESLSHLSSPDIATTYLIKSIDAFLIAFVLIIFAYGVHSLFISDKNKSNEHNVLKWIQMPSISHLKNVLAEVIIIIFFVKFLKIALISLEKLEWEILTLPVSILLLALSLKFLGLKHESNHKKTNNKQI